MDRLAEVGRRPGHAAGRRHRRHHPDLALHLPRGGGGQGRLGDPQGAEAARARPGADRLPDLRPAPVRHGHASCRRSRSASRPTRTPIEVAVLGCAVNGIGEAVARRLRHHRRQERGPDLRPRQAAAEGPAGRPGGRAVRRDRQVDRRRHDRVRRGRRPPRAPSGCEQIEEENAGELTPERLAALEAKAATAEAMSTGTELPMAPSAGASASRSSRASAWTRTSRPRPAAASPAPECRGRARPRRLRGADDPPDPTTCCPPRRRPRPTPRPPRTS